MTQQLTPLNIPMVDQLPENFRTSTTIAEEDLNINERQVWRTRIAKNLLAGALQQNIRNDPSKLVLRDTLPGTDLSLASSEDWLVAGAGVAGTYTTYINLQLPTTKTIVLYGVGILPTNPLAISVVQLFQGPNTNYGSYQIEGLDLQLRPTAFFSEEIYYGKEQTMVVKVMPRTGGFAANTQRLKLHALTVEPLGDIVSAPSS